MMPPDQRAPNGEPPASVPGASAGQPGAGGAPPPVWGAPDDLHPGGSGAAAPVAVPPGEAAPESPPGRRLPRPHLGRPRLTPVRVTLGIALIGCLGLVTYGLVARDATQIPVLTAGEFVTGIVFALLALAGAWAAFSRARGGQSGRALLYAILGGVAALLSAGAFAGAVIQALILNG